jgi:hypothetical protein
MRLTDSYRDRSTQWSHIVAPRTSGLTSKRVARSATGSLRGPPVLHTVQSVAIRVLVKILHDPSEGLLPCGSAYPHCLGTVRCWVRWPITSRSQRSILSTSRNTRPAKSDRFGAVGVGRGSCTGGQLTVYFCTGGHFIPQPRIDRNLIVEKTKPDRVPSGQFMLLVAAILRSK